MLFMPESSKLQWVAACEEDLERLQSAWISESFLTFSPEFPMFILGREPTLIHYSELGNNLGFILWRWGYAPKDWLHPQCIQTCWCRCIEPEFPISVNERHWVLFDPLNETKHDSKTVIDMKNDKLFVSTIRYAPNDDVLMHFHLFCANSMNAMQGWEKK